MLSPKDHIEEDTESVVSDQELFDDLDFMDLIIFRKDGNFVSIFHLIVVMCQIISGYFYGWLALFGLNDVDKLEFALTIFFELTFTF